MMEGVGSESAQGSVSALEKREGGGLKARGAGGKEKRPLDVTLTAGEEPTDVGRREEEPVLRQGGTFVRKGYRFIRKPGHKAWSRAAPLSESLSRHRHKFTKVLYIVTNI